ncbi:hypothetical protein KX729_09290 [Rhizobium sp. XQZ8]|uniref:hypothetical protein n=1 Tax=Rhizobium populisoli TaxID=2859785 RepID=UPI001CA56082|nr:hypothetical protein [Rhizobium populisoli]MBW6421633.1 hypothetical protein [Rhizobium populisoli]
MSIKAKLAARIKRLPKPIKDRVLNVLFKILKFLAYNHRQANDGRLLEASTQYDHFIRIEREVPYSIFRGFNKRDPDVQADQILEVVGWDLRNETAIKKWYFELVPTTYEFPNVTFKLSGFIAFNTKNEMVLWKLANGGDA